MNKVLKVLINQSELIYAIHTYIMSKNLNCITRKLPIDFKNTVSYSLSYVNLFPGVYFSITYINYVRQSVPIKKVI